MLPPCSSGGYIKKVDGRQRTIHLCKQQFCGEKGKVPRVFCCSKPYLLLRFLWSPFWAVFLVLHVIWVPVAMRNGLGRHRKAGNGAVWHKKAMHPNVFF